MRTVSVPKKFETLFSLDQFGQKSSSYFIGGYPNSTFSSL